MKKPVLQAYYSGILKRLNSEVDILNQLIPHNLTKGIANEDSIKNIIQALLPKKYSIGTGMVIDSFGNSSRQCDIIIYDAHIYPNLFSQTANALYPVESVLACIEVKTFLDEESLNDVVKNSKSINSLKHYEERIVINHPTPEAPLKITDFKTVPPYTYLFAYRSNSKSAKTWKRRFEKHHPSGDLPLNSILLENSLCFGYIGTDAKDELRSFFFPLRGEELGIENRKGDYITCDKPNHPISVNNSNYLSTQDKFDNDHLITMPERAFLSFLLQLMSDLDTRPKHIRFDAHRYIDEEFFRAVNV